MIESKLIHIPEPKLTFGFDQKMEDPRDGLTLFGAYSKNKHIGQISVGIIGSKEQREYVKSYLKRIHQPVISEKTDVARPYFPGLEATFDIFINIDAIQEVDVPRSKIDEFLKYTDGHQRVFN